jgi:hypothetical protein
MEHGRARRIFPSQQGVPMALDDELEAIRKIGAPVHRLIAVPLSD